MPIITVDPSEVQPLSLPPMTPAVSHQTPAQIRASGGVHPVADALGDGPITNMIDSFYSDTQDRGRGAVKSLGRMGYNLGRGAVEYTPVGRASRALYGDQVVDSAFGLGKNAPEYGALDQDLQYLNGNEKFGGTTADFATALIPAGGEATVAGHTVPFLGDAAAAIGRAASSAAGSKLMPMRMLARLPMAARESIMGALFGQAQNDDPGTGAVVGGVMGGALGARPTAIVDATADRLTKSAETQIGRAISPTKAANKEFVEKNAQAIIREVPGLGMGGLDALNAQAGAKATAAGQKIDAVLKGATQGDESGLLRSARGDLKTATASLLLKAKKGVIELAPKTREGLEVVRDVLSSVNPRDTNIETLQQAHSAITDALAEVGMEATRRSRQAALGAAGQVIDQAMASGAVSKARNPMRSARNAVGDVIGNVTGTRTSVQPMLDALDRAKLAFGNMNAAGQFVADVPEAVAKIEDLQTRLRSYGPEVSVNTLRSIRQHWDNVVAGANGLGWLGSTIADESSRGAHKLGANAVRDELGNIVPEIVPHNHEFNFQANLRDAIADTNTRRTGQTGGLAKTMATIGAALGISGVGAAAGHGQMGLFGAAATTLVPMLVTIAKSPEFQMLSAKTRLLVADALRSGRVEPMRQAVARLVLEAKLASVGGFPGGVHGPHDQDLTDEELKLEMQKLHAGEGITPGITDHPSPDHVYGGGAVDPAPEDMPQPGDPGYQPTMPQSPDYLPGDEFEDPAAPPDDEARAGEPLGAVGTAGASSLPSWLVTALHAVQRPLLTAPALGPDHPVAQRALDAAAGFTSPLDLAFLGESAARPLAAGTRLAPIAEAVGKGVSGTMALAGLQTADEGARAHRPGQMISGGVQAGLGALGLRSGGAARAGAELASAGGRIADRLGSAVANAGTQAVMGPALGMVSHVLADSPLAKQLLPDDDTREAIANAALVAGGVAGLAKVGESTNRVRLGVKPESRASAIHSAILKDGGYSVDVKTGEVPSTGTMVGLYPNTDKRVAVIPIEKFSPADVTAYARRMRAELAKPGRFLGGWKDTDANGREMVYLDVPERVSDVSMADQKRRAAKLGEGKTQLSDDPATREAGKQLATFTLDDMSSQPVGSWRSFVESPEFRSRMDTMADVGRQYLKTHDGEDWWQMHGTALERVYGKERMEALAGYLASTAPMTSTAENVRQATEYMRREIKGEPVVQPDYRIPAGGAYYREGGKMPMETNRAPNLRRVASRQLDALQSDKVREEARALQGDQSAIVLDTMHSKLTEDPARGIYTQNVAGKIDNPKRYAIVKDQMTQAAKAAGATPRDYAAAVWVGIRQTIKNTGELFGTKHRGGVGISSSEGGETSSTGYAQIFARQLREKADRLGISVEQMEQRLRNGDANLLGTLLATGAGAAMYQQWQAAGGSSPASAQTPAARRAQRAGVGG